MDVDPFPEEFRPRLVVWQLHPYDVAGSDANTSMPLTMLSTEECIRTLDGISRTSKPIVVLAGDHLLSRDDFHNIIRHGTDIGLKLIIEARPEDLTEAILSRYAQYGPRIFRIVLNGTVSEDMDTRYKNSSGFQALEETVKRLNHRGFEVHLSVHLHQPDVRTLAFNHDYAIRRSARGLYCHLAFDGHSKGTRRRKRTEVDIDRFIEEIASMKSYSPEHMYFSPQCIKYGHKMLREHGPYKFDEIQQSEDPGWNHWCLAGKTYAFITPEGSVRPCAGLPQVCGDLRSAGFDFKKIWESSELFLEFRQEQRTCAQTREVLGVDPAKTMKRASP